MYLSKLELHGFKSFAERTVVDFSQGVTAVVGPNGCGKSNIVDAVRWVIGEQRARILRSEKMENIIFNGTNSRRALGMAEVLLTIVNDKGILPVEYSEVTIGRRLFRSGESEYLLNGVQCRLKDITDLFMDTGMGAGAYSVIELKMIEDILSENAQDRRTLFEEAAGITKYKIRRGQTIRKLNSTQGDLNRVRDIVDELEKRVRSLQRQAQKASRFKKLDDRLRHLTLSLAVVEHRKLATEDTELKQLIADLKDQVDTLTAQLSAVEADYEALRTSHIEREQEVVSAQTDLSTHTEMIRSAEADLRLNRERINALERDQARAAEDERLSEVRFLSLEKELLKTAKELKAAEPKAVSASEKLDTARNERNAADLSVQNARNDLQSLAHEERSAREQLSERTRTVDRLHSRIEVTEQDLLEIEKDCIVRENAVVEVEERVGTLSQVVDSNRVRLDESKTNLESTRAELSRKMEVVSDLESSLRSVERRFDASVAEVALLESLLDSYEEFSEPVQFLAGDDQWTEGRLQTVSDILTAQDRYRPALEAALGSYADCIVVDDEASALRAIVRLRDTDKGRATFILLDRICSDGNFSTETGDEDHQSILRYVSVVSDRYKPLAKALLKSSFIVQDLNSVTLKNLPVGRYFNLIGEWVDSTGLLHAGSDGYSSSPATARMSRREQHEEAVATREGLEKEIIHLKDQLSAARNDADAISLAVPEEVVRTLSESLTEAEKAHSRGVYEREVLLRRRTEVFHRRDALTQARTTASTEIEAIESGLEELRLSVKTLTARHADNEESFKTLENDSRNAFSLFNEANILAVQTKNRFDNLLNDRVRIEGDLKRLEEEAATRSSLVATFATQRADADSNAKSLESEIKVMMAKRGEYDARVSKTRDALMEIKVAISDMEARLRDLRRERERAMTSESEQSVRRAQISTRLTDLVESMLEDFDLDLSTCKIQIDNDFDEAEARSEIQELRSKVRNLGPVNALALESFEEEQERLEFLHTQMSDLEHAESTLRETIGEINQTASTRFNETFEEVRTNFNSLFAELFGADASADLILKEPNDPLESPIEILAKPRGKKPSVLAQLSGGEKTLTAIALLFSIYLVKPSPFCILDEVDAPLDDANIIRFMHLIRTFAESTQFVLVTHNKRTMEAADRMYGITMPETGISRLVGVTFEADLQLVA